MTDRRTDHDPRTRRVGADAVSAAAAVAAVFAPAALTGLTLVDAVERALVAGFVSYVGAHGRRWTWLLAAVMITVPARGASLVLCIAGLMVIVAAGWPKRRSRPLGALGIGLLVNAVFWYPADTGFLGLALAAAAMLVLVASGFRFVRSSKRRVAKRGLITVGVVGALASLLLVLALGAAYGNIRSGGEAARDALDAARSGDADGAAGNLASASDHFDQAAARVDGPLTAPALLIPGLSQQVQAVRAVVDEGREIAERGNDLVATADYDNLQYQGQLDLEQVAALAAPTARADRSLTEAQRRLDDVRAGRLLPPLRSRVDQFADAIDEARQDTALASDLLEVTPGLFGGDGDRRYLIVFLTPAELRGAGGFIGSYAELEASDGDVTLSRSGRIADLIFGPNRGNRTISGPADYLDRYGRFHPDDFVQDATFSPNFPSDAAVLQELYPQAGGSPVDGVIAVDPTGLAALLQLTGPVSVPGLDAPLTADNAAEVLTRTQYLDLPDEAERGEILTEATRLTFEKLTSGTLPAPSAIASALSGPTRSGHLRVWSPDPAEQAVFERLGADGTLAVPKGSDGLSVVQQNSGNNKLDAYLHRTISYEPTVDAKTGALTARLHIELRNDVPSIDLPDPVVGNNRGLPTGTNLAWLTIFTPHQVASATVDGKPAKLGPSTERGLNAWDTPAVQIPPGGTVTIDIELRGGVDLRDGYRLTILPQPVANPDVFSSRLEVSHGQVAATQSDHTQLLDDEPLTAPTRIHVPIDGASG